MTGTTYKILGCVKDPDTGNGVPGLTVSWAKVVSTSGGSASFAYTTTTDSNGEFEYSLPVLTANTLLGADGTEDITLHVVENGTEIITQTITLTWSRLLLGHRYCLETESTQPPPPPPPGEGDCMYFVTGRLLGPNGEVYGDNVTVKAMSKTLRNEVVMASGSPFGNGGYSLAYGAGAPCDPESPDIDLVVVVCDNNDDEIGRSDVWCNPPRVAQVDVVIGEGDYVGRPLLDVYVAAVTPHLDGAQIAELTGDDVGFLGCRTGLDPVTLALIARAHALHAEAEPLFDDPSPALSSLDVGVFFAFVMSDIERDLISIVRADEAAQRAALERAATRNHVPEWQTGAIDTIVAELETLASLVEFATPTPYVFQELVEAADPSFGVAVAQELFEFRQSYTGTDFWVDFDASSSGLNASDVAKLEFVFALSPLVSNYIPLIEHLVTLFNSGTTLQDLARNDAPAWDSLMVANGPIPPPNWFGGADDAEKRANYTAQVALRFENAYPTAASARSAVTSNGAIATSFLDANPSFDLATSRILVDGSLDWTLPGGTNESILVPDLQLRQRLHTVAPTNEKSSIATALANDATAPITSAQDIVRMGRTGFVTHFSPTIGEATASEVYDRAQQRVSEITHLVVSYQQSWNTGERGFTGELPGGTVTEGRDPTAFPELAEILGPLGFCACEDCGSVFGPSAYLADLLEWLTENGTTPDAINELRDRRPDVFAVHLDCANATTVMPQIDLVNELLEARIIEANDAGSPEIGNRQTTWTAEDLRAHPEHLQLGAYTYVAAGGPNTDYHPWTAGWDLSWAEIQEYLKAAGTSRAEVMLAQGFQLELLPPLYHEIIGISPNDASIVFGTPQYGPTNPDLHLPWGETTGTNFLTLARDVKWIMERGGLSFDEVGELLDLAYIQGRNRTTPIELGYESGEECTLEGAQLRIKGSDPVQYPEATDFDRIHRFTRLRRAMGWPARELDMAISTLVPAGEDDALEDENVAQELSQLVLLQKRFPTAALEDILVWGGNLWAWRYEEDVPSYYETLFYNPSVGLISSLEPDPDGTRLNGGDIPYTIGLHDVVLQSGLGVTNSEFALLLATENVVRATRLDQSAWDVSLVSISALRRNVTLSRALGISLEDFFVLRDAYGVLPFGLVSADPSLNNVNPWVRVIDQALHSGLSPKEIGYLVLGRYEDAQGIGITERDQMTFVLDLVRGLLKIEQTLAAETARHETTMGRLEAILGKYVDPEDASILLKMVNDEGDLGLDKVGAADTAEFFQYLRDDHRIDLSTIQDSLTGNTTPEEDSLQRAQRLLDELDAQGPAILSRAFVVEQIASFFGFESRTAATLLQEFEPSATVVDVTTLLEVFQHPMLVDPAVVDLERDADSIAADGFKDTYLNRLNGQVANLGNVLFGALLHIHKASLLISRYALSSEAVIWILDPANNGEGGAGVVNVFPTLHDLSPGTPGPTLDSILNLSRFADLSRRLFQDQDRALRLFSSILGLATQRTEPLSGTDQSVVDLRENLANETGWSLARIEALVSTYNLQAFRLLPVGGSPQSDFFGIAESIFTLEDQTGAGPAELQSWTTPPTGSQAFAVKNALKSRVGARQWPSFIEKTRDTLRQRQRTVLVDWLVAQRGYKQADDLFRELLIDTQVTSCAKTSRIRQALSSVQTYVQRVILNMETRGSVPIKLSEEAISSWSWMSRYRVWEAARKVFLYPENWTVPELRQDKSELFVQLEADLQSNELTEANIERAYTTYLEQLHDIARLDIAGVYWEERTDDNDEIVERTLHVVGVRPGTPNRHYYRRWVDTSYWTPWEEIPFQIETHDVLLVMHQRRLWMFWPKTMEKAIEPPPGSQDDDPAPPEKYSEVRLAYSRNGSTGWEAVRETQVFLTDRTVEERNRIAKNVAPALQSYTTSDGLLVVELLWRNPSPGLLETSTYISRGGFRQSLASDSFDLVEVREPDPEVNDRLAEFGEALHVQGHVPATSTGLVGQAFEVRTRAQIKTSLPYLINGSLQWRRVLEVPPTGASFYATRDRGYKSDTPILYRDWLRSFLLEPIPGERGSTSFSTRGPSLDNFPPGTNHAVGESGLAPSGDPPAISATENRVHEPLQIANVPQDPSFAVTAQSASAILSPTVTVGTAPTSPVASTSSWPGAYRLHVTYHPFTTDMLSAVRRNGLEGIFRPPPGDDLDRQSKNVPTFRTDWGYMFSDDVESPLPREIFEFRPSGAYSSYNWEVFFHAPMLIVDRLISEQQFEEAQRWLHFIFDPTTTRDETGPKRYWNIKPFNTGAAADSVLEALQALAKGADAAGDERALARSMAGQISRWRNDPFDPHLVASLRPGAYQRYVLMRYLDLLVEWGDSLFRQDTLESVNEAFQLYLLASNLLGARPVEHPADTGSPRSFDSVQGGGGLGDVSDKLSALENTYLPSDRPGAGRRTVRDRAPFNVGSFSLYFCMPPNEKLLRYWDTVADRLFKIRNCLNIEGTRRDLALFDPPIDPALLVRAAAAGIDIASALRGLLAPLPHYRFRGMLRFAKELAQEVRSLGQSMLAALEKEDAELLAQLRSEHENKLVSAQRLALETTIQEAREARSALDRTEALVRERKSHYEGLIENDLLPAEEKQQDKLTQSRDMSQVATVFDLRASILALIPDFKTGVAGLASPELTGTFGGQALAKIDTAIAAQLKARAGIASTEASVAGNKAAFVRRGQDWDLRVKEANRELDRIEVDKIAADLRIAVAEHRLSEHEVQQSNAEEARTFLHEKYTNEELYSWMGREIKRMHYQAYDLAVDLARRAERTYQHELGDDTATFVQPNHYDGRRRGLLAGEMLIQDLHRMEAAYYENNRREFEMTTQISLADLDPVALLALKRDGLAFFSLPEALFDLEQPGMYMRRMKSVRVTIPAVTGPYTNVSCKLTLLKSEVLRTPDHATERTADRLAATHSITTSSAQNDAGLFNENFEDERYLPFEGKGLVSDWSIELPNDVRSFDYETISDVVLTISYTARFDGGEFKTNVIQGLLNDDEQNPVGLNFINRHTSSQTGLVRAFSAAQEFPDAIAQVHASTDDPRTLSLDLSPERFPGRPQTNGAGTLEIRSIYTILRYGANAPTTGSISIGPEGGTLTAVTLTGSSLVEGALEGTLDLGASPLPGGAWSVEVPPALVSGTSPEFSLDDVLFVVEYTVS